MRARNDERPPSGAGVAGEVDESGVVPYAVFISLNDCILQRAAADS